MRLRVVIAMVVVCLLGLTGCAAQAGSVVNDSCSGIESTTHTLYIGTNSQHDNSAVMSIDDACAAVGDLALKYSDGYTIYISKGGWKDAETGQAYREDSVVLVVIGVSDDDVHALAKDAASLLDQKSILIEHGTTVSEYFS